jgi:ketosteroid isomerase-like protein
MTRYLTGVLAVFVLAAAPGPDEAAVRGLLQAQVEAWNRGDLEAFMIGYWNSPELVFQSGATTTRGWQPTLERYRQRYQAEGREMGQLRFNDLHVEVVAPEVAFARGGWHLTFREGKTAGGLFTLLLRRQREGWRIVHDHTSGE